MNTQASFSLRGRNPDVLTCIAKIRYGVELAAGIAQLAHAPSPKEKA